VGNQPAIFLDNNEIIEAEIVGRDTATDLVILAAFGNFFEGYDLKKLHLPEMI
jgi:hypothetical protein